MSTTSEGRKRRWDLYRECLRAGLKAHRGTKMREMERMLEMHRARQKQAAETKRAEQPKAPAVVKSEVMPSEIHTGDVVVRLDRAFVQRIGEALGYSLGRSFGEALQTGLTRALSDRRARRAVAAAGCRL